MSHIHARTTISCTLHTDVSTLNTKYWIETDPRRKEKCSTKTNYAGLVHDDLEPKKKTKSSNETTQETQKLEALNENKSKNFNQQEIFAQTSLNTLLSIHFATQAGFFSIKRKGYEETQTIKLNHKLQTKHQQLRKLVYRLRESCWVFSSDIISAACSIPEFILCGSRLLTQFSILLKIAHATIILRSKTTYATKCDRNRSLSPSQLLIGSIDNGQSLTISAYMFNLHVRSYSTVHFLLTNQNVHVNNGKGKQNLV